MRIGVDMLALQSPGSRARGVGRFGRNLVGQMLARGEGHEFVLYAHDGYPIDGIPSAPNATLSLLRPEPALGERFLRDAMERLGRTNPHDLDILLTLNPFELCPYYDPPNRQPGGLPLAALMHDLIPFLFQEDYLAEPLNAAWNYRRLALLRHYDVLVTNSHATRADCLKMLDLPGDRVVTVGGAGDASYFTPDRAFPPPRSVRLLLNRLGIVRPFVYCVSGIDERKNLRGLLEAFARLPRALRRQHQLVVTCFLRDEYERRYRDLAAELEIADSLVLTGEVDDADLRALYRRCAAFAFPSRYEGLGLPLLEAMLCGAPVIAGDNSSQIEVVGDAGLRANVDDPADVAGKIARVLADPDLAQDLGRRAMERARSFRWEDSADRPSTPCRGRRGRRNGRPEAACPARASPSSPPGRRRDQASRTTRSVLSRPSRRTTRSTCSTTMATCRRRTWAPRVRAASTIVCFASDPRS